MNIVYFNYLLLEFIQKTLFCTYRHCLMDCLIRFGDNKAQHDPRQRWETIFNYQQPGSYLIEILLGTTGLLLCLWDLLLKLRLIINRLSSYLIWLSAFTINFFRISHVHLVWLKSHGIYYLVGPQLSGNRAGQGSRQPKCEWKNLDPGILL